jgi:hypothetical protein
MSSSCYYIDAKRENTLVLAGNVEMQEVGEPSEVAR